MVRTKPSGVCYAAIQTLADDAGIEAERAKRLRRELREKSFWIRVDQGGGNGRTAHYKPNLDVLNWSDPLKRRR